MNGSRACSDEQFQGTTDKPFKGHILDWKICWNTHGKYITGIFSGHPEFNGKRGYTSYIVNMHDSEYYREVETLNSRYRLIYDDEEPDREFWDMS